MKRRAARHSAGDLAALLLCPLLLHAPGCATPDHPQGGGAAVVRVRAPGAAVEHVDLAGIHLGQRPEEGLVLDFLLLEEPEGTIWLERGLWKGIEGSPVFDSDGRRTGIVLQRCGDSPSRIAAVAGIEEWLAVHPLLLAGVSLDAARESEGSLELGSFVGISKWIGTAGGVRTGATVAALGPGLAAVIPWRPMDDSLAAGAAVVSWTPVVLADHGGELELMGRAGELLGVVERADRGIVLVRLDREPRWIEVRCTAWAGELLLGRCEARVAGDAGAGWTQVPDLVAHHLTRCDLRRSGEAAVIVRSPRWGEHVDRVVVEPGGRLDQAIAHLVESLLRGGDMSAPELVECEVRLKVP